MFYVVFYDVSKLQLSLYVRISGPDLLLVLISCQWWFVHKEYGQTATNSVLCVVRLLNISLLKAFVQAGCSRMRIKHVVFQAGLITVYEQRFAFGQTVNIKRCDKK